MSKTVIMPGDIGDRLLSGKKISARRGPALAAGGDIRPQIAEPAMAAFPIG